MCARSCAVVRNFLRTRSKGPSGKAGGHYLPFYEIESAQLIAHNGWMLFRNCCGAKTF